MAKTKVVIGYSPNQRVRRTTVVPDDDSQIPGYISWIQRMGESVLVGLLHDYNTIGPDAMLAKQFSIPPVSDRHAVVNGNGIIVAVEKCDPVMEQHPLGRLVHDPLGVAVVGRKAFDLGLIP